MLRASHSFWRPDRGLCRGDQPQCFREEGRQQRVLQVVGSRITVSPAVGEIKRVLRVLPSALPKESAFVFSLTFAYWRRDRQ